MKSKFIHVVDSFHSEANVLRNHFDRNFANPRETRSERFVWDYWHVPDQYTLLRTPAYNYFPKLAYQKLHRAIQLWGQQNLGCAEISPPWMSCYVDGCKQELHSDVPHGPWAFVFSLSPNGPKKFQGGETLLVRPEVLNYWQNFADSKDRELNSFVQRVASPFNRLTVFDPRFPHGVTEVKGTKDPREGRLVIHGWFTNPRPFFSGPLNAKKASVTLDNFMNELGSTLENFGMMNGTICLRLHVSASGAVSKCDFLTHTLISVDGDSMQVKQLSQKIRNEIKKLSFTKAASSSQIVLPLLFR